MKISYNWLKEYIDTDLTPEEAGRILTDCGLEVETIEKYESVKGGLKGVVIGKVISTSKHPNADKLTCCKVDIGSGKVLDIVCGAPNVEAGQKVPVATVGAIIYSGDESFAIKASKLRGEPSEGMICAEDELGLGSSHAGIMVLDPAAEIGTRASAYFNVTSDHIFEIGLTPNRSDATSHYGVARDLAAAINNREKQHPAVTLKKPSVDHFKVDNHDLQIPVIVEDQQACPRYSGVTISGVRVNDSPGWLKERLKAIGLRPINNIVDITNYVLMETGQPLHAFDAAEIEGNTVIVKKLASGTRFMTLDGVDRELLSGDLMICNAREGMCIGGVFGGTKSGVSASTSAIFLESACFDPTHIRKTSKHHGLKTDASFRFERGADPNSTVYALKRAALLIRELAGGTISSEVVDVYPQKVENHVVDVSYTGIECLVGKKIERESILNILRSLEIEVLEESPDRIKLSVPTYRVDVTREADIVEEILRIYGYNNIEFSDTVHSSLSFSPKPDPERIQNLVSDYLSNNGFNEIMTNSLSGASCYATSEVYPADNCVRILNPLSRELDVMRQTLLYSGLESVAYNLNRKQNDLKLYEFGYVYQKKSGKTESRDVTEKFIESKHLAIFSAGNQATESWYTVARKTDFHFLKSYVSVILRKTGLDPRKLVSSGADTRIFSEGETLTFGDNQIVTLGKLLPSVPGSFNIKQDVYYADLDWQTLLSQVKADGIKFREVSRYPEVRRDLAMLLGKNVRFSDIESLAYKNGKGILRKVNLFDVFEEDRMGKDMKSYAVSFILQDTAKTLTEPEIDKLMNRFIEVFENELGAKIRR